jgi:hypothetical protein
MLRDVVRLATAGKRHTLAEMRVPTYNTSAKQLARYRDLCVLALDSRKA